MTVSSNVTTAGPLTCNGSVTDFNFSFKIFQEEDIDVIKITTATGAQETLVLNTDYTVALTPDLSGGYSAGVVTIDPAPAGTYKILIVRSMDFLQEIDLTNQGEFLAETHEEAFDRAVMLAQQLSEEVDRCVKVNPGESVPEDYLGDAQASAAAAAASEAAAAASELAAEASAAAALASEQAAEAIVGFDPDDFVQLADINQSIDGVKTFQHSPIVPAPTTDLQAATKKYVDDTAVALTGNQTVAGIKNFSSSPLVPTPTTDYQASTKKYVDDKTAEVTLFHSIYALYAGATGAGQATAIILSGSSNSPITNGDVAVSAAVDNVIGFTVKAGASAKFVFDHLEAEVTGITLSPNPPDSYSTWAHDGVTVVSIGAGNAVDTTISLAFTDPVGLKSIATVELYYE